MPEFINPSSWTAPRNPYCLLARTGNLVFVSGQSGFDRATGKLADGIQNQTRQTLRTIFDLLATQDISPRQIVKTTVFLTDIHDFAAMNEAYREMFGVECPARSTVQVCALPADGALVEIEVIASTA